MKMLAEKDQQHYMEGKESDDEDSDSDYNSSDNSSETCDHASRTLWEKENFADEEDLNVGFDSEDERLSSVQHSTTSSVSSSNKGKNDIQDLHQWAEESQGESSDGTTSDDDVDKDKFVIPTTNAGKRRIGLDISKLAAEGNLIPNHVLMNNSGSLLLRRNRKLVAKRANRNFLQRLVATSTGQSVPLIYPEATIFSNLFWSSESDASTMSGAIPNVFLKDDQTLHNYGIASLYDMLRTRILDPSLLSSTNHQYQAFCWDAIANLGLRGSDTHMVLRRGWAHVIGHQGLRMQNEGEIIYDTYAIDSRATINQIAAANARKTVDVFFTWTCNQTHTFAVRKITEWIESNEAITSILRKLPLMSSPLDELDEVEVKQIRDGLRMSAALIYLRTWMEITKYFLRYLQVGKDSPFRDVCGGMLNFVNRSEIQDESKDGKLPHQHTLVYFRNHPMSDEAAFPILQMIRGSVEYFATADERKELLNKGFVSDPDLMIEFLQQMKTMLAHHCARRCQIVVRNWNVEAAQMENTTERHCKQPNNRLINPEPFSHYFLPINVVHSQDALQALVILDLIYAVYNEDGSDFPSVKECRPKSDFKHLLEAKRHVPPCGATDMPYSPGNPFLFAMLRCAMNLQYCTSYLVLRYLAKYLGAIDKATKIVIRGKKQENEDSYHVDIEDAYNTKITGNKMQSEKEQKSDKKKDFKIEGRIISIAEMGMQFFQYPIITTTFKYEFIPTQPMAMRPILKKSPFVEQYISEGNVRPGAPRGPPDLNANVIFPGDQARRAKRLVSFRLYDHYQVTTYLDAALQPGSLDRVTLFGLRPPELKFLKRITKYWTLFTRSKQRDYFKAKDSDQKASVLIELLHQDIQQCPWIDGLGYEIRVRRLAVPIVLRYIDDITDGNIVTDFGSIANRNHMRNLFQKLHQWIKQSSNNVLGRQNSVSSEGGHLAKIFLYEEDSHRVASVIPIYWYRTVKASNTEAFFVHLLLSLGSFTSELELFSQGSMKNAFIHARLFTASSDLKKQEQSVNELIQKYVTKQLVHLPAGTRTFDTELTTAFRLMRNFLLKDVIVSDSLPAALYTRVRRQCEEEVEAYCKKRIDMLCLSLHASLEKVLGAGKLPSMKDIKKATFLAPVDFDFQSCCPNEEHKAASEKVIKIIKHYKAATVERTKSLCYIGAGGVGKTMALRSAGLYSLCQGLFVCSTTLTGKRGAIMGGEHLHLLLKLSTNNQLSAPQEAERALVRLLMDPKRWELLRRIDVLLLDELGQIEAKLLDVMDIIFKGVRKSSQFMGGVLLFSTMDVQQMKPVHGLSPILCPAMTSSFVYQQLSIVLRTEDPILQRLQVISRMPRTDLENNESLREEFTRLLVSNCHFVSDITDESIPVAASPVYCFARNLPAKHAEQKVLQQIKSRCHNRVKVAVDWEETRLQAYPAPASASTSEGLDSVSSKLPRELVFYPFAIYEFTYNDSGNRFFQSEPCMILDDLPREEDLQVWADVEVLKPPHGVDDMPSPPIRKDELLAQGWTVIKIGKHPDRKYSLGNNGLCGTREQYGLRHRISMTIHAVMGSTVSTLVLHVGSSKDKGLWEKAQVVVSLSRTKTSNDVYFIGDSNTITDILWKALLKRNQFDEYIEYLVKKLCGDDDSKAFTINQSSHHPFRPKDVQLPNPTDYCCYILVSVQDPSYTYVGQTINLRKRLNQHNSFAGGTSSTNRQHLKPWALLAYVVGFESRDTCRAFEREWQCSIENEKISNINITAIDRIQLAERTISHEWAQYEETLRLIVCGSI